MAADLAKIIRVKAIGSMTGGRLTSPSQVVTHSDCRRVTAGRGTAGQDLEQVVGVSETLPQASAGQEGNSLA